MSKGYVGVTQNATDGIPVMVKGVPNILYVGSGDWYTEMQRVYGNSRVFRTLQDAINAVPPGDGTNTFGYYNTKIIVLGNELVTGVTTIPVNRSGIEIIGVGSHYGSAGMYTSTALGAGVPILLVQGNNIAIRNMRFWADTTTQTGDAIHFGDATYAALYGLVENVRVQGAVSGSYLDFKNGIVIKDAKYSILRDVEVTGGANTAVGIHYQAGVGNGKNHRLDNVRSHIFNDTGDTAVPLKVDADQNHGIINGGQFVTHSTADAITIAGDEWTLTGGGLAATEVAVGVNAHIDITGTEPTIGEFYVKQLGGATAASLFDESHV